VNEGLAGNNRQDHKQTNKSQCARKLHKAKILNTTPNLGCDAQYYNAIREVRLVLTN
jgi:hypothetical protein